MVDIGANVARMQADMRKLIGTMESGFGQIRSSALKLGGVLAGAFSVREIIHFGQEALDTGDRLSKMSQSIGISVETLSALSYAAKLSDIDLEGLAKSAGILSRNMFDAQGGTGEAAEAFNALGINVEGADRNLLSSDKVMGKIADRFAGMEDGATKTGLAMKIFGKSGAEMIPLLNQGSAALAGMKEEAEKLGLVVSTETAQQMERVNDNFTRMKSGAQGAALQIMTGLAPTLENLTNILLETEVSMNAFRKGGEGVAFVLKGIASTGIVVYTTLDQTIKMIAASGAAINAVLTGDFKSYFEIMKLYSQDSDKMWAESAALISRIWSKEAEDALRAGNKIKKALGPGPTLPGEDQLKMEKRLQSLFEEAEALQMGADAYLLYQKGLQGATTEQKEYALYLLRLIEAHNQEKEAVLQRFRAMEEEESQLREGTLAVYSMVDALKIQAVTAAMSEEETFKFQLTLKGASKTLLENADAYFAAIRAARQYGDDIELLKGLIEETKSPMDRYQERMAEIQRLLDQGMISPEKALQAEQIAWSRMIGGEKDTVAAREQVLLDFGDRVRAQNLFTADYAIEQIQRQAAIFKTAGADEVAVAIWAAKEKQKASREWVDGAARAFEEYAAEATNAARNVERAIGSTLGGMEDLLVEFIKTGKANFKDFVDAIIADLARLGTRQFITGPLAGWLSGIFAGGAGAGAGGWQTAPPMHRGGIAGVSSLPVRSLPAAYLAAAPRYHGGLQPDEFPAILQRGEGVFTPEQMKALGNHTDISIPISITAGALDPRKAGRLRRDLEAELEPAVRRIIERYI